MRIDGKDSRNSGKRQPARLLDRPGGDLTPLAEAERPTCT